MAILPTREDLEKLYEERGPDVLVWYALRNTLRALPVLGRLPLASVWKKDTVRHVAAVSRVCLILIQWASAPKQAAAYARADAASKAAKSADVDAAARAVAAASTVAVASVATDAATRAHAAADEAAYAVAVAIAHVAADAAADTSALRTYPATDAHAAAKAAADVAVKAASRAADDAYAAAFFDYKLLKQQEVFTPEWWYSQPLWVTTEGKEPKQITKWRQAFDHNLRELCLDFLADDLNDLWEGRLLRPHAINYLKDFSEAELNDSDTLRRLILEGETAEHIHAVRVLLLGPGGAGKSSLADRLQGKPVESAKRLTMGVDYLHHQPLDLYKTFNYLKQGDKPLDLYLWDFGGQTIFHGLHSAFLHENCVYVLVVDSRHEQAPDEWLHQIMHLAGRQAKVLLATNWYESCETRQNEARLLREFPDLMGEGSFFYFSCHDPEAQGLQNFVQALEQACLDSQRMVLKETLDVNAALQEYYQKSIFLDEDSLRNVIKSKARSEVKTVIDKLQQLGFLVRVDKGNAHYCLKPEWVVDNAYAVLYSEQLRKACGVLALDALQDVFEDQVGRKHTRYLVEFLQTRSLCCDLRQAGDTYFFPDAAPANELPEASQSLADPSGLTIRLDLHYLPLGFHAGLVNHLFGAHGIRDIADIWRQGFILRKSKSRAVVHYLPRKGMVEVVLVGSWEDYAGLLHTLLEQMKATLADGKGESAEKRIVPSVVLEGDVFSVHSAERLVEVLKSIESYEQLFREVRKMAGKINVKVGDGSQVAIDAHNVTQKYNSDNTTLDITTDQRQQIAAIIGSLLNNAGSLNPESLMAVAEVNKALAAPQDKPEARNLLGKVWNGLKEVVDVTKTGTEIAGFVLEHQAAIAGTITTAVALLK